MSTSTQTTMFAQAGRVLIQHDKLVGTQHLTPDQARAMAEALLALAAEAEAQARHQEN